MSFWLDVRCFFGTIRAVADHDGVVEGGTGRCTKRESDSSFLLIYPSKSV